MSNRVRVQQVRTGALTISIPRALAQALHIVKGDTMEWVLVGGELALKRSAPIVRPSPASEEGPPVPARPILDGPSCPG
jgi:Antidote-toxin recognition MazE, bacterial antitoxin